MGYPLKVSFCRTLGYIHKKVDGMEKRVKNLSIGEPALNVACNIDILTPIRQPSIY